MNTYFKILILNLALSSFNVTADRQCEMSGLSWLVGHWQMKTDNEVISEHWQSVSEKTMEGFGTTKRTGRTISTTETLRIVEMSQEIFLLAKVTHNPLPVAFQASNCGEKSVVFENPDHDFPNRLNYFMQAEKLHVEVRDNTDNGFNLIFNYQLPDDSVPNRD